MTTPSHVPADVPAAAGDELTYVYAVGRDGPALRAIAPRLSGADGGPVRVIGADGLGALVSTVPADAFGESGLATQLEDLARLEAIARAHHAVIDAAFGEAPPILPMRLATVYLDDARVGAVLTRRHGRFRELLDRLENHVELGVKVYADPRAAVGTASVAATGAPAGQTPGAGAGRAYLRQRRAQQRGGQAAHRAAAEVAGRVAELAGGVAVSRAVHRPQQGQLATHSGVNVANEAYLVPVEHADRLRQGWHALAEDDPRVSVEVTGPWAPYSFTASAEDPEGGGNP
ncbi:GvpL/GvpF family gas vesicle protein [Streptomyces alkaliphilus]|uniref:GvpL/GvpF family gas vesicle protein n=1 Tax=Streptomyces alkaliphilus TaxID=1472722 RepID=UPI001180DEB2|nr:gas vesicle synthesis protein [Streptomyces alkaliphilus]